jgi:hypothetical protein
VSDPSPKATHLRVKRLPKCKAQEARAFRFPSCRIALEGRAFKLASLLAHVRNRGKLAQNARNLESFLSFFKMAVGEVLKKQGFDVPNPSETGQ